LAIKKARATKLTEEELEYLSTLHDETLINFTMKMLAESSSRNQLKWETEVSNPEERWLLERLWNVVSSRAADLGIKIKEAKVVKFDNPEEDEARTILQLTCYTKEQAFALWDSLSDLYQELNDTERNSLLANIGLRIYY